MSQDSPTEVFVLDGIAIDSEAIIRIRPKIEDEIRASGIVFDKTDLVTWMNEDKSFGFEIHFLKESNEPTG